jgi:DNA-binding GntR family transcriptional regulator
MAVKRDCMRDQIRRELLGRIVNGTYCAGDRLVELQIAREFATSQAPVREALRELEACRLVETEPFRGTRVRGLSEREMAEAAEVRGALEELAARSAARALCGKTGPLRATVAELETAAHEGDFDAYARHNMTFHRQIVEAGGNEVLLRIWDSLMLEARTRISLGNRPVDLTGVAATHRPIVDALEQGDGDLAGRLLREHAEQFGSGLYHRTGALPAPSSRLIP